MHILDDSIFDKPVWVRARVYNTKKSTQPHKMGWELRLCVIYIFCFAPSFSNYFCKSMHCFYNESKTVSGVKKDNKATVQSWGLKGPVEIQDMGWQDDGEKVGFVPGQPCSSKLLSKSTRFGQHWPRHIEKLRLLRSDLQHGHTEDTESHALQDQRGQK